MAVVDEEVGAERASREVVDAARAVRHVPQHDALHARKSVSRKQVSVSGKDACVSRKRLRHVPQHDALHVRESAGHVRSVCLGTGRVGVRVSRKCRRVARRHTYMSV